MINLSVLQIKINELAEQVIYPEYSTCSSNCLVRDKDSNYFLLKNEYGLLKMLFSLLLTFALGSIFFAKPYCNSILADLPRAFFHIITFFTLFLPSILIKIKHADNPKHS